MKAFIVLALCEVAAKDNKLRPAGLEGYEEPLYEGKIVGGKEVSIVSFPYQLSLREHGFHICGASVISSYWALSAAHCTVHLVNNTDSATLRGGSSNRRIGGLIFTVDIIKNHPYYNADYHICDVSVLRSTTSFTQTERSKRFFIFPIDIVPSGFKYPDGTRSVVSGWGMPDIEGSLPLSVMLAAVDIPIVNLDTCRSLWGSTITDGHVCAGEPGRSSCHGDSGGPLVTGGRQFGIVSYGSEWCGGFMPAVFTNIGAAEIHNFISWSTGIGSSCVLSSGGAGQCQPIRECSRMYSDERNICGFIGYEPFVCCDVVRRHCDGIQPSKNKFTRVVGATNVAKDGEFPFMALIMYTASETDHTFIDEAFCAAVLISKRFLLTAAQCIRLHESYYPYSVKLGTIDLVDPYVDTYLIDEFHTHEEYSIKRKLNDIAIVKVARDILLNESIKPICVYNHPDDLSESVDLSVMGWGKGNNDEVSSKLLQGIVHPVPRATCQASYNNSRRPPQLKDTHMCAIGDTNKDGIATDSCAGDSGGPLTLKENNKNYLVAITSFGPLSCGNEDIPGVYSRVFKFLPWLIEKGVFNNL